MGLATIIGLGFTVAFALTVHLLTNAIPKLTRLAVARAAKQLPPAIRSHQEAAWLGDFAGLETDFERLRFAVECWIATVRIQRLFARFLSSWRLRRAREALQFNGAVIVWASNHLGKKDQGGFAWYDKIIAGLLLAGKEQVFLSMKEYALCLERDIAINPRSFTSKDELVKELFLPIAREMKLFKLFYGKKD